MIPIVLTGTIIPKVFAKHNDKNARRIEYLRAIAYYTKFSKVYFIENSDYDLENDPDFGYFSNFAFFKYNNPTYLEPTFGKGFYEFKMIDEFVVNDLLEPSFVKITGRYIYYNFERLFKVICDTKNDLIIDSLLFKKHAVTSLFFIKRELYLENFLNAYRFMNDAKGATSEKIINNVLCSIRSYTYFCERPLYSAFDGFSGEEVVPNSHGAGLRVKNFQRKLLAHLSIKKLIWI